MQRFGNRQPLRPKETSKEVKRFPLRRSTRNLALINELVGAGPDIIEGVDEKASSSLLSDMWDVNSDASASQKKSRTGYNPRAGDSKRH